MYPFYAAGDGNSTLQVVTKGTKKMKKMVAVLGIATFCCMSAASTSYAGDNGNGTVTVNGLVWLKDAGCLGPATWDGANSLAAQLAAGQCGLKDNSTPGQWRLPTKAELFDLYNSRSMFSNITGRYYWTTTASEKGPERMYRVQIGSGTISSMAVPTTLPNYIWPVKR